MDTEALWQENKKWLMATAAGGLLLLIGVGVISSFYASDARRLEANARQITTRVSGKPAPENAAVAEARKEGDALAAAIQDLAARLRLRPVEPYQVSAGERAADLAYNRVLQETRDRLAETASVAGVRLPYSLGLPDRTPGSPQELLDSLRALQVVNQLVPALIESGVRNVEEMKVETGKGSGFCREVAVMFDLTAPLKNVQGFLRQCVAGDQEVALGEVRILRDDKLPRAVRASVRALALSIDEEQPLSEG
jgi:hypothetical protein